MPLKVGLFGFGRTGAVVAKELASNPNISLEWVCRRTLSPEAPFAAQWLKSKRPGFYSMEDALKESFSKTAEGDLP